MSVILNTSHKHSLLITTFAQCQCQSLVPTVSVFLVYYCTFLYHYIRQHEKPIKYRKSHVDWRSTYRNLWKRFFPFVSGADDDVSRTGRISSALILVPTQQIFRINWVKNLRPFKNLQLYHFLPRLHAQFRRWLSFHWPLFWILMKTVIG